MQRSSRAGSARGSRRALPSVLDVQLDRLADTLKLLMSNSVPETLVFVVCKIIRDWVDRDFELRRDPVRAELKVATVACGCDEDSRAWSVPRGTRVQGLEPVLPSTTQRQTLSQPLWMGSFTGISLCGTVARRRGQSILVGQELTQRSRAGPPSFSQDSTGPDHGLHQTHIHQHRRGPLLFAHLADVMLSSRGAAACGPFSRGATRLLKPLLDNLSRFLASDQQPDMFGLNAAELPDVFLRSGSRYYGFRTQIRQRLAQPE
ncbi:hypothetical protein DPEC_G00068170 [Dallia pectoralis]|uniref:Uncharacterized protein n=1 Tax=Dallia pectoralis TaxID=75939 RepID=A0ACC2H2A1_DALPE|nr:hypothetical protein DPEC_G00068170 [Dallia pectoralis]